MVSFSNNLIPCKEVEKVDSMEVWRKVFGKLVIASLYGHADLF